MTMYVGDLNSDAQMDIRKAVAKAKAAGIAYGVKTSKMVVAAGRKVEERRRPGMMKLYDRIKQLQDSCPHEIKDESTEPGHHLEHVVGCRVCGKELSRC